MHRLIPALALIAAMSAFAASTAEAQFTPLAAIISIESDGTIYRTVGGETLGCLAPPGFEPSPNVAYSLPQIGDVTTIERSFNCEDVTLFVEQRFQVIELDDGPSYIRPSKVNVKTTSYLTYAANSQVYIKIGEDFEDWDLTTGEFWIGHRVTNQPGVQFESNHYVDTVNTTFSRP
jgi:hypothetical protein